MRWEPIALHAIIGHGGLHLEGHESVDAITDMVARWQAGVLRLLALRFLALSAYSFVPRRVLHQYHYLRVDAQVERLRRQRCRSVERMRASWPAGAMQQFSHWRPRTGSAGSGGSAETEWSSARPKARGGGAGR